MAIGKKTGGRVKGTPNRSTEAVREALQLLGCDPIEGMAIIALNKLECGVCRGEGKTKYILPVKPFLKCSHCGFEHAAKVQYCAECGFEPERDISLRVCQSCKGTLMEACSPDLRGKMNSDLAGFVAAKLKAIEITNPDGFLRPSWIVVRPPEVKK